MKKIGTFFRLIRLKHYVKNFLIFFPLIFTRELFTMKFFDVFFGFISFSLMASVVYIVNDIKDIRKDKMHPIKKNRLIASGKISKSNALIIAIILYMLSLVFSFFANSSITIFILLLSYLLLNVLYTFKLKEIAVMDLLLLVLFYIIRVYYGAVIIDAQVSNYLYLTVMSAAFYFSLGKRKNELINDALTRDVLKKYSKEFLSRFMDISLTLILVFYSLWAITLNEKYIISSVLLIFAIFMEYSLTIDKSKSGDPTEVLFKNKILLCMVIIYTVYIIYLMR